MSWNPLSFSSATFRMVERPDASRRLAWLNAWLPVFLCAMVFVVESTVAFGADHTDGPLRHFAEGLFGTVVDPQWGTIHHYIRKTGHFLGYGLFSLACFRGLWIALKDEVPLVRRKLRAHGLAIFAALLVASADEIHQAFLPNRTGQFSDVVLDTSGAAVMGFLLFLGMRFIESRRARPDRAGWIDNRAAA